MTALDARPAVLGSTELAQVDALWQAANYLSAGQIYLMRLLSAAVIAALSSGRQAYSCGDDPVAAARAVLAAEPGLDVDYVETARFNGRFHLLAAVRAGQTRLIDNAPVRLGRE